MTELPDRDTLLQLRREGLTLKQIADQFACTPARVWATLAEGPDVPIVPQPQTVEEMTGWRLDHRHRSTGIMRHLVTFSHMELSQEEVPADKRDSLMAWVQDMNSVGVVVDYHPDAPPNDASRTGGFFYRTREHSDDLFFRRHVDSVGDPDSRASNEGN